MPADPSKLMSLFVLCLVAIPLLSAILVAAMGAARRDMIRWVSLSSTVLTFLLSLAVALAFAAPRLDGSIKDVDGVHPSFMTDVQLLAFNPAESAEATGGIRFTIGIDGINIWLVTLTTLLMICAVLGSWESISERSNEYYAWMLVLQAAMTGVFISFDVVIFYIFFELTLVPLFFLIGIWGGPQRQYAARKFFVYTLAGSLITLLGVLGSVLVFSTAGYSVPVTKMEEGRAIVRVENRTETTFSIPRLTELTSRALQGAKDCEGVSESLSPLEREKVRDLNFWLKVQFWIFLTLMVGFAVKVPLVPVHTWLPLAHVEAPTAGSVLLAGVLLKLGTYGFLRLCLPLAPDASLRFGAPFIGWLAVIGIIYGAFCALQQTDIKKMVAYSSVSHLGFCMLGLFALNEIGLTGSLLQMINHGLSTGALFLLVGMLYDRYHTRKIDAYGGMGARMKLLAVCFIFITMSSVGLPGLNGFIGEAMVLMGMYASSAQTIKGYVLASFGATGVVLGAWYMLTLVRGVFFGKLKEPHHEGHGPIPDMNSREIITLAPLMALCLWIGMFPQPFLRTAAPELRYIARLTEDAQKRYDASPGEVARLPRANAR